MKNILVLGGVGQLGQCIQKASASSEQFNFIYLDEVKGNILDNSLLRDLFEEYKPAYIINCRLYGSR
jgi:dTDP-4-dehydrorhamnose reductase